MRCSVLILVLAPVFMSVSTVERGKGAQSLAAWSRARPIPIFSVLGGGVKSGHTSHTKPALVVSRLTPVPEYELGDKAKEHQHNWHLAHMTQTNEGQ